MNGEETKGSGMSIAGDGTTFLKGQLTGQTIPNITTDNTNVPFTVPAISIPSIVTVPGTMTDTQTTEYRYNDLHYVVPKFKVGSVVTYKEEEQYKMGRILTAKLYGSVWTYKIDGA